MPEGARAGKHYTSGYQVIESMSGYRGSGLGYTISLMDGRLLQDPNWDRVGSKGGGGAV